MQQESWPSADSYFQSSTPEEDIFIREKRNMFIHLMASVVNPSMREPLHGHQWKHHRQHTDSNLSKLYWWSHCIALGHLFLASWDAIEPGLVSESVSDTVEPSWLMWPWRVKIPTEDLTSVTMDSWTLMEMMLDVAMGMIDMEDDKVADMVLIDS